ncbi:DUF4906 domain-containing protein [Parabacteroides sp. AF18-52]|mgnify:CR=1 FL=1|jgi:hypothetical protein|uniref:fimbrial protein n=1 Tax=Parabacteroides TaxID=375288 RepID=UPI000EFF00F3|nr:fimbrial protein [Parabacteroides sp. AF18-52]RHR43348.1 DUF4906 domain-containing protein [Parabacteroides sp. AF18-52]
MIHSIKNICNLLAGFLLFVSCTDETLIGPKKIVVEEGLPVTAKLAFGTADPVKIETRASDISENDQVRSLAVLIFKRDGGSMVKVDNTFFFDADTLTMGAVTLKTTTGDRYVYAVANYKSSVFGDLTYQLENVNTLEGLNELCIELEENNTSVLDGQFLMSGYFIGNTESTGKGACCITENGVVDRSGNSGFIDLKRIMSSVKFKVYSDTPGATFIVDSWQVKNIPQRSFVLEQNGECSGMSYDNTNKSSVFVKEDGKKTFSFLMMESRKKTTGVTTRDEREKMSGSSENFVNAPENSAYVILKGTFSGTTNENVNGAPGSSEVTAYVTYYIHLGDWRALNSGTPDYNNYSILRNNKYVYTVNVRGVDDLIVEVQTDTENWSGDGDMLVSTDNARIFDAHYETTIISFTKKMIGDLREKYSSDGTAAGCTLEQFKEKFLIHAATPKNDFVPSASDIGWVSYRRNTEGDASKDFMDYKSPKTIGEPLKADGFKEDLYHAYDELADDGTVYYTCFIDEYFYGDANGNYDGSVKLSNFINQQPRILQICTKYVKNDEISSNSSISMAAYTFSQRSICTVYDMDRLENNVNGWGTEWKQEGEYMGYPQFKVMQDPNSLLNGRTNIWNRLKLQSYPGLFGKGYDWNQYVDYKTNTLQRSDTYKVYGFEYACFSRNRDLNGNGKIDANEFRWYLPAINQYMAFYLGADVLPEEVRLASADKFNAEEMYASSTLGKKQDYSCDFKIFWACEGSSIGFFAGGYTGSYPKKPYRCVRNLRSVQGDVDDIVVPKGMLSGTDYEKNTYEYLYFDNLNSASKRKGVSNELSYGHTNFDEENRVSDGIQVGTVNQPNGLTALNATLTNPCASLGPGWRLPNQRELTIIVSHRRDNGMEGTYLLCSTQSKYPPAGYPSDNQSDRIYFGYRSGNNGDYAMTMWFPYNSYPYRCVKDVKR